MGASAFSKFIDDSNIRLNLIDVLSSSIGLEEVGDAFMSYVNNIGYHEPMLTKDHILRLFGNDLHDLIFVSPSTSTSNIPAFQLFSLLYMLSSPEAQSVDEKFDAILGMCQFKPIPESSLRTDTFNHCSPNVMCCKSELTLAMEAATMGLAKLCCKDCGEVFISPVISQIVDDVFQSCSSKSTGGDNVVIIGDTVYLPWYIVRNSLMGNRLVHNFLSNFKVDMILLSPLRDKVLRSLAMLEQSYFNVSEAVGSAMQGQRKGRSSGVSVTSIPTSTSTSTTTFVASSIMKAKLSPRKCLDIILDSEQARTIEREASALPLDLKEADELEIILTRSSQIGTVDLRFFKMVCLSLLTFSCINENSRQKPRLGVGLNQSCLCYVQRLFTKCAIAIGYHNHPQHISRSQYEVSKKMQRTGVSEEEEEEEEESKGLYDLLELCPGHYRHQNLHLSSSSSSSTLSSTRVLSRINWLKFQCDSYALHTLEEKFDSDVVEFFSQYLLPKRAQKNETEDGGDGAGPSGGNRGGSDTYRCDKISHSVGSGNEYIEDTSVVYDFIVHTLCMYSSPGRHAQIYSSKAEEEAREGAEGVFKHLVVENLKEELRASVTSSSTSATPTTGNDAATGNEAVLRQHIHYFAQQIKGACEEEPKGLHMGKIMTMSTSIRADIVTFAKYFIQLKKTN